ncbi:recombination protein RecR [Candidatus Kaiserbacteria bacterium]|nr:recombination protein RecR [Candidatus Kaiserbacteria bacterium]
MSPIDKLSALFEKFPGIGPRQARRFVQYLLVAAPALRGEIAEAVRSLGAQTAQCKKCYRWFPTEDSASTASTCAVCANTARERTLLFVVEKDADIDNVERSGYKGLYFVLGGIIPLASEEPEKHIRLRELLKRVEADKPVEIILGLSATTEGDHTRQILAEKLQKSTSKVSSLGRGLSTGSELEYADPDTIAQALGNRH